MTSLTQIITSHVVPEQERISFVDKLLGIKYVLVFEPAVFRFAETLAHEYKGAYWTFHTLGNGGFYMAPRSDTIFAVSCENGFDGQLSADGLGIVACMYAFSHLSFVEQGVFVETCANQHHLLRAFIMEHAEARAMLQAID